MFNFKVAVELAHGRFSFNWHVTAKRCSERQYNTAGVLVAQGQWDAQRRKQGRFKSWHDNGQPKEVADYFDDEREGWSRIWHQDGGLEKECRFVKDEGQGRHIN
ncbi:hypothetical protein CD932_16040 [Janthinobacterium sp. PC23-8]|nr:hypothetical protein CD932_16040 [Janthinobacterium sp. PC23-8]